MRKSASLFLTPNKKTTSSFLHSSYSLSNGENVSCIKIKLSTFVFNCQILFIEPKIKIYFALNVLLFKTERNLC